MEESRQIKLGVRKLLSLRATNYSGKRNHDGSIDMRSILMNHKTRSLLSPPTPDVRREYLEKEAARQRLRYASYLRNYKNS
jgi:recombinational DNA repair ATPase RecF